MNRRRVLLGLSSAVIAKSLSPRINVAGALILRRPIEPVTIAIMVVQIGIAIANLFGSKGPGIADLLNIQTDILKHISAQIGIVQQSLTIVFESLDELKKLVRTVPNQTVIELYRARISGAMRKYGEVTTTYSDDLKTMGIDAAQQKNGVEIEEEILKDIRDARSALFSFNDEMTVPIICEALQIESHAMILANYRFTRRKNALNSYKDWLLHLLDPKNTNSVPHQIIDLEDKLLALQKHFGAEIERFTSVRCYSDVDTETGRREHMELVRESVRPIGRSLSPETIIYPMTWAIRTWGQQQVADEAFEQGCNDLKNAGESLLPKISSFRKQGLKMTSQSLKGNLLELTAEMQNVGIQRVKDECPKNPPPTETLTRLNNKLNELDLLRNKYLTYKAIRLCATSALEFIDKLSKNI